MIVNDIKKVNQILKNKVVKEIIQNDDGISINFTDGTQFRIKTFQYSLEINNT